MKKNIVIIGLVIVAILVLNGLFFYNFYKLQINQQKNNLFRQSEVCSQEIERVIQNFESDLNYILFSDDISELYTSQESDKIRKLQMFYSSYRKLIKNIDIYDNNKNVLNIFLDKKQNFVTDFYVAQRQRKLAIKEEVVIHNSKYQYTLPIFKGPELIGNVLVTINLKDFILSELNKFHLKGYTWQWVIDVAEEEFYNIDQIQYNFVDGYQQIINNLDKEYEGLIIHRLSDDSAQYKLLTIYTPFKILNKNFGIVMSTDYKVFLYQILYKLLSILVISIILFILTSIYFINQIKTLKKKIKS